MIVVHIVIPTMNMASRPLGWRPQVVGCERGREKAGVRADWISDPGSVSWRVSFDPPLESNRGEALQLQLGDWAGGIEIPDSMEVPFYQSA